MSTTFGSSIADYAATYQSMALQTPAAPIGTTELTDAQKQVFTEAKNAWNNYIAVPANKQQLEALPDTSLPQAQQVVANILNSPQFATLRNLLDTLGLDAASFSIGLNFEVELVVGFSGTLGAAIGIGNSKGVQASEFLSLWVMEGAQAGAFAGVQFGLWNCAPGDMGGYSMGTEGGLGADIEVSAGIYYTIRGGLIGVAAVIGAGIDEGVSEVESYTFILGDQGDGDFGYIKPVYQKKKNNLVIINSVNCKNTASDGAGNANEVYFIFQADGEEEFPYPTYDYFSMQGGDTWNCGRSVWFNDSVSITLYDEDDTSDDDVIGTFAFKTSNLQLNKPVNVKSNKDYSSGLDDVEYTLTVTLVAQNV